VTVSLVVEEKWTDLHPNASRIMTAREAGAVIPSIKVKKVPVYHVVRVTRPRKRKTWHPNASRIMTVREAGAVIPSIKVKKVPVSHVVNLKRSKRKKIRYCVVHTLTALEIPVVGKTLMTLWVFASDVAFKHFKQI